MELLGYPIAFALGVAALAVYNRFKPDRVHKLGKEIPEELAQGKQLAGDLKNKLKDEIK